MRAKRMSWLVVLAALSCESEQFLPTELRPLASEAEARHSAALDALQVGDPHPQAKAYAARFGVSVDEALRRLRLQSAAEDLNGLFQREHPETFAGLVIEHEPSFGVVALFTRGGAEAVSAAVRDPALAAVVRVERAVVPLPELQRRLEAAYARVRDRGIEAGGGLNLRENRPEIYVPAAAAAVARAAIPAETGAALVIEDQLPVRDLLLYGALALSTCTSGFHVKNSSGMRGVTTAGHCGNQSYNGNALTTLDENDGGSYDIQWHNRAGATYDAVIDSVDGGASLPVAGTRPRNEQGGYVCKQGKTTPGFTCGTISTTSYCHQGTCTFVRVSGGGGQGGDSGAPWFSWTTAYGSHVGHIGNDAYYMAVDYFSGIGVSVVTKQPMTVTVNGPTTGPPNSVVKVIAHVSNSSATPFSYAWLVNGSPKPNCPTGQNWCSGLLGVQGSSTYFYVKVTSASGEVGAGSRVVTAQY